MKDLGYEIIEVGDKDVQSLAGCDIVAFQIAAAGAMGYPGGVFFITSDSKLYFTCYLKPSNYAGDHASMSWENLVIVFPPLKPLKDYIQGLIGYGVKTLDGWEYKYLGAGNHLLIKQRLGEAFINETKRLLAEHPDTILYNLWMDATLNALKADSNS